MARAAAKIANILILLYEESFGGEEAEMFRIGWPELRNLAGIAKLTDDYLVDLNSTLSQAGYALMPFDEFLVLASESDFRHTRKVSPRILEQNLPDWESEIDIDDDSELAIDEDK